MAKELPFFKFEPCTWENGNIQLCSFECQGVFINVCSMYWQRLGDLPYKLAVQKICSGNATALDSLIQENIIKVVDGMLCIDFLNEQLAEFENTSAKNSESARERWRKHRENAVALQTQSEGNAIREEERREYKKREEKKEPAAAYQVPFLNGCLKSWNEWEAYRKEIKKKLSPSTAKKQIQFLGGRPENEIIAIINQSITNGWTGLFELKGNGNNFGTTTQSIRRADAVIETGKSFGKL